MMVVALAVEDGAAAVDAVEGAAMVMRVSPSLQSHAAFHTFVQSGFSNSKLMLHSSFRQHNTLQVYPCACGFAAHEFVPLA